jgi:hypothetical protein
MVRPIRVDANAKEDKYADMAGIRGGIYDNFSTLSYPHSRLILG